MKPVWITVGLQHDRVKKQCTGGLEAEMSPVGNRKIEPAMARLRKAHGDVVSLFEIWLQARSGCLLPVKSAIDPLDIPNLLPSVWMYEYVPEEDDFFCRIAGAEIEHAWGTFMLGTPFRDIVGKDNHAVALKRWKAVLEIPQVQYAWMVDGNAGEEADRESELLAERLVLPLCSTDGSVRYTMGLSVYSHKQDDRGRTPPVWNDVLLLSCHDLIEVASLSDNLV